MSIPKPSDWQRWCEEVIASWQYLRDIGPDMILLAKKPTTQPDGYTAAPGGERVSGDGSPLTSTEGAANRRGFAGTGDEEDDDLVREITPDWVMARMGELFANAREARQATTRAHLSAILIDRRGDSRSGREVSGDYCGACGRFVTGALDDKLKSGYCQSNPGCYEAWRRYRNAETEAGRDPARETFKRRRLAFLNPPETVVVTPSR